MTEINHVDQRNFDRNLVNIAPFLSAGFPYRSLKEAFYSLNLHPTHPTNIWDKEIIGGEIINSDI